MQQVLRAERRRTGDLETELATVEEEVSQLRVGLDIEKSRMRSSWRVHCQQLSQWDAELASGHGRIARLRARACISGIS